MRHIIDQIKSIITLLIRYVNYYIIGRKEFIWKSISKLYGLMCISCSIR